MHDTEKREIESTSTICRVELAKILDLRHRILRPGLPIKTATFPSDNEPSTRHYAVLYPTPLVETTRVVCCASFMLNQLELEPAWQLRGMATETEYQGKKGFGRMLLKVAEKRIILDSPIRLFWCNARQSAVPFYKKQDWVIISHVFDVPSVGPHYKMMKRLLDP